MLSVLQVDSTLTDRYQTTVPETVRHALRLGKRDKIRYMIQPSGEVVLTRASGVHEEPDPVLGQFLAFLAKDMATHPERLQRIDRDLVERGRVLTAGVAFNVDAPLSPQDE